MKHFDFECKQSGTDELGLTTIETYIGGNIIPSTLFLFDLAEVDPEKIKYLLASERRKGKQLLDRIKRQTYAVLIYLFARVSDERAAQKCPCHS